MHRLLVSFCIGVYIGQEHKDLPRAKSIAIAAVKYAEHYIESFRKSD